MMENLSDLMRHIESHEPGFHSLLQNVRGWRGLFDPYCDEWHSSTVQAKAGVIGVILQYIDFPGLVRMYEESWDRSAKREYILQDLPDGIAKLAAHLPEAAEYKRLHLSNE